MGPASATAPTPADIAAAFVRGVGPRLAVPPRERAAYAAALRGALAEAGVGIDAPQYLVLVDRSPLVQAALLWHGAGARWRLLGAAPVSTGKPGRYDYFETPLGVFDHSLENPDYRAEGTENENGIRGYGREGMRVYDFGWAEATRGWGEGGRSPMRLQMHATDPVWLEPHLGEPRSKGCVRIPATLNDLIDRHGLLDEDYDRAVAAGSHLWVLRPDRVPVPDAGRYMVVVETPRTQRPAWAVPRRGAGAR